MADSFYVKKVNDNGKKRAKHNIAWVIGCVVLIFISITFILPSTGLMGFQKSKFVFGKYGNKEIDYSLDSYFYNAINQYMEMYNSMYASSGANSSFIQSIAMQGAFESASEFAALLYYADKSGFYVGRNEIDDFLVKNIATQDGKFNAFYWESLSRQEKDTKRRQAREDIQASAISSWIQLPVNENDIDFILSHETTSKDFSYVIVSGEDAENHAADIISSINYGSSFDDVIEKDGLSVKNVNGYLLSGHRADVFSNQHITSSTEFFDLIKKDEDIKNILENLKADELYKQAIKIDDDKYMVVICRNDFVVADNDDFKSRVRNRISSKNDSSFSDMVQDSSLYVNNYQKMYDKLFKNQE